MCYAIFNEGAFINKDRIHTCSVQSLNEAKGSISTKYWENHEWEKLKLMKNNFAEVSSYKCIGYEYVDIARGKRNF